jgi:uncharacterized protein
MIIEDDFEVAAEPDRVYAFLLDVHNVASCVRGAELIQVNDDDSYSGRIKMKVGPITAGYSGVARIVERDDADRRAVLKAHGKETKGSGTAAATATMTVRPAASGSRVVLRTEFEIAGRLAQFGRGIMEDVSAKMVQDLAANVRSALLAGSDEAGTETPGILAAGAAGAAGTSAVSSPAVSPAATTTRRDHRTGSQDGAVRVLPLAWTVIAGWWRRRIARWRR